MSQFDNLDTFTGNWKHAAYYWWAYGQQMRKIYEDTIKRHNKLMEERYATPMGSTNDAGTGTTNESSGSCRGGDACSQ